MEDRVLHGRYGRCAYVLLTNKLVKHVHAYPQVILCLEGSPVFYKAGDIKLELQPDEMVMVPAWQEHSCEPCSAQHPSLCLAIHIDLEWLNAESGSDASISHKSALVDPKLTNAFKHFVEGPHDSHDRANGLLSEMLYTLMDASRSHSKILPSLPSAMPDYRIRKACHYMAENLDATWDLGMVASKFNMSRPHFNCQFKAVTGTTPAVYANELRMQKATRLLCDRTRPSVSDISDALGFSASANFIRFFRNHVGLSPYQFRLSSNQLHMAALTA